MSPGPSSTTWPAGVLRCTTGCNGTSPGGAWRRPIPAPTCQRQRCHRRALGCAGGERDIEHEAHAGALAGLLAQAASQAGAALAQIAEGSLALIGRRGERGIDADAQPGRAPAQPHDDLGRRLGVQDGLQERVRGLEREERARVAEGRARAGFVDVYDGARGGQARRVVCEGRPQPEILEHGRVELEGEQTHIVDQRGEARHEGEDPGRLGARVVGLELELDRR